MRPLFKGEGCAVDAGNPLSRMFDAAHSDPMHAQMMREGYLANGMGPGMGMPGMMGPMMKPGPGGAFDQAWQDVAPGMAGPMEGPMLGEAMHDQLRHHMAQAGPAGPLDAGFFTDGPAMMPHGLGMDWANEFGRGSGAAMPVGPMGPQLAHASQMEAAFQHAQMDAVFQEQAARASIAPPHAAMEAAFQQAHRGPVFMPPPIDHMQMQPMEAAFREAAPVQAAPVDLAEARAQLQRLGGGEAEQKELESLWQASSGGAASSMAQAWDDAGPEAAALREAWASSGGDLGSFEEAMGAAWDMAGMDEQALMNQAWSGEGLDMDQLWSEAGKAKEYQFQSDNPYLDEANPLALAERLLREGRDMEALLALEAEVTRNQESSEGWRMLGQLYASLDQDVEAIQCLRRGHEADPYNLDSLLALGVSCTNELDQLPALRYLRQWVENHEEHGQLVQGLEPPPEYEYEAWRRQVTDLFNQAAASNPLDADVFVALGVMENINRNYDAAVAALATACRLRPNDHTGWNKLGATLANSGTSEKAVVAYHQGLQLKPNYARSWSNLAIAHANLGQHQDAARFYLSSLVLNPKATHIWTFLRSAVLQMHTNTDGGPSNFDAIDRRDLSAASKLVDGVLDPAQLPKPSMELSEPPDAILASIGL